MKRVENIKIVLLFAVLWVVFFWDFLYAWNPFVWNLLWTQLEIWLNQRSNVWASIDWKVVNALSVHQESSIRDKYDLISELDKAKSEQERLQIIDQYIVSLSNSMTNGSDMYNYEQSQVDYFNSAIEECEEPIKAKNSEFSDAIKAYNYEKAEAISNEIADLRACVARNEVYAKSHASYALAAKSLGSLQKKVDYLSKNKEKIAKYYEILKPDLLKELYDISKTVESEF